MNPEENNNQAPFAGPTPEMAPESQPAPASETASQSASEPVSEPTPEAPQPNLETPQPEITSAPETQSSPQPAPEPALQPAPEPSAIPTPEPALEPTSAPELPSEPAPSLDQVAADLTSAAASDSLDKPVETTAPADASTTDSPVDTSPIASPADASSTTPLETIPTAPEGTSLGNSTDATQPAAALDSAPLSSSTANSPMDTTTNTAMDTTMGAASAPDANAASFAATESGNSLTGESTIPPAGSDGEEPPLVPAEPVPGSIGSAISYSDSTPDHSAPTAKPKKSLSIANTLKLSKENLRLVAIIGIGIVLVAIVVVVLIFIIHGSSSTKKTTNTSTNTNTNTQPIISSVTCTKEGGADVFPTYGELTNAKSEIIAMYRDNELTNFGTNFRAEYPTAEAASFGQSVARDEYNQKLVASSLTSDPFESNYSIIDNVLTVTHQADADDIDASNARVLDFYVVRSEVVDDPDTIIDEYEGNGFICEEK